MAQGNPATASPFILVVDDQAQIRIALVKLIKREKFQVEAAATAAEAIEKIRKRRPDLVVLDVGLPDRDGVDLCREIRSGFGIPVLMLSGRGEEFDRVLGLEAGAEDYVVKPFLPRELVARLRARLRPAPVEPGKRLVRLGSLRFDPERRIVEIDGDEASLTPIEHGLLSILVAADGRPVSRRDLLREVWGHEEAESLVTRTVDQQISRLRRKLGPEASRLETVARVGYKLKR